MAAADEDSLITHGRWGIGGIVQVVLEAAVRLRELEAVIGRMLYVKGSWVEVRSRMCKMVDYNHFTLHSI